MKLTACLAPIIILVSSIEPTWSQTNRPNRPNVPNVPNVPNQTQQNDQTEAGSEKKKELTEEEKLTQIIEDAKMLAAKRNTALVGANATLLGIRLALRTNYATVASKLKSGEIVNLGKYPNPRKINETTVSWKRPEGTEVTEVTAPAN